MTAATVSQSSLTQARDRANAWLARHHDELTQRARYRLRRVRRRDRQEAIAEVLASATAYAHSAAQRGRLDQVTPFWLVEFASRNFLNGRRTGGGTTCILSPDVQARQGVRVRSIEEPIEPGPDGIPRRLGDALVDRDGESPYHQVRVTHDYPYILATEQIPAKGRRLFVYLAETHGEGSQTALGRELHITPARVTQLKRELGRAFSRHDYHGPLGPRLGAIQADAAEAIPQGG